MRSTGAPQLQRSVRASSTAIRVQGAYSVFSATFGQTYGVLTAWATFSLVRGVSRRALSACNLLCLNYVVWWTDWGVGEYCQFLIGSDVHRCDTINQLHRHELL